jgi:predicted nucleotidyltransferase
MRLTTKQTQIINQVVARFAGETAAVYLFGSRLNDQARGGDVDILIEMDRRPSRIERGRIKMELEQMLGLPVDILIQVRNTEPTPFQIIAHAHAERLEVHA